ncbi:oxamate carbamoyltransferase subunit AllH family protein, partial [Jiangella rhizosphaerae]
MPAPTVPTGVRAIRPWPGDASRQVLPGAASTAVAGLVGGPRLTGEVVAATRTLTAVLVDHGAGPVLLCLTGPAAVRLPCAVVTPWPVSGLRPGQPALVGEGELRIGDDSDGAVVTVGRWWRTRPAVIGDVALARRRTAGQDDRPGLDGMVVAAAGRLGLALLCGDDDEVSDAVGGLLGLGPGLTPAGDDVLAGALVVAAAAGPRAAAR